jgi:hypothetical protein
MVNYTRFPLLMNIVSGHRWPSLSCGLPPLRPTGSDWVLPIVTTACGSWFTTPAIRIGLGAPANSRHCLWELACTNWLPLWLLRRHSWDSSSLLFIQCGTGTPGHSCSCLLMLLPAILLSPRGLDVDFWAFSCPTYSCW